MKSPTTIKEGLIITKIDYKSIQNQNYLYDSQDL